MTKHLNTEVITEVDLQARLAELCREVDSVDVAVSYAGRGACDFFPREDLPSRMSFIVDMSRSTVSAGLTNPQEVDKLLQLGAVRSLDHLHAKVFLFGDKAAIVGSANLSANSIENQYQCCLLTRNRSTLRRLRCWFNERWTAGSTLDSGDCTAAMKYFPKRRHMPARQGSHTRLRRWRTPLLESAQFSIDLSKAEIRRALQLFRTNRCGYDHSVTCVQGARNREEQLHDYSGELRALLRRIDHWTREDANDLFNLACIDARHAMVRKPGFLKQPLGRIRDSMRYLFFGGGNPMIRVEKVADNRGQYHLHGLALVGVAMLLHLWRPNEFAIWNGSAEKGLRVLKVTFARGTSMHLGQAYMDRTAALKKIMCIFQFPSLAVTDHFVDAFGKKHLKF